VISKCYHLMQLKMKPDEDADDRVDNVDNNGYDGKVYAPNCTGPD